MITASVRSDIVGDIEGLHQKQQALDFCENFPGIWQKESRFRPKLKNSESTVDLRSVKEEQFKLSHWERCSSYIECIHLDRKKKAVWVHTAEKF